jgi:hypothetical protein
MQTVEWGLGSHRQGIWGPAFGEDTMSLVGMSSWFMDFFAFCWR